jgi:hypothetical protein
MNEHAVSRRANEGAANRYMKGFAVRREVKEGALRKGVDR